MRCPRHRRGIHHHDKPHCSTGKIHLAERGDRGRNIAAKDVDHQLVAQLQLHLASLFGGKGNLRRTGIAFRPPLPRCDLGARWRAVGETDAPVAHHHPMIAHHVARFAPVDHGQKPAQHRRAFHFGNCRIAMHQVQKRLHLGILQINKEETRRLRWQIPRNRVAKVRINLAHHRKHRKPQPQRQHHRQRL